MQKEFDTMFKSMTAAAEKAATEDAAASPAQEPSSSTSDAKTAAAGDASFQDTIRRTMERMQASGDQATAAAAESSPDDLLAEMMKQFGQGGGMGEGSDEDFSKMLMGMMEQLTNKEILYEPMKELDDKFPEWLEKNRATTKPEELKQYEEQQGLVKEIVAKFEEKTYDDSNAADREYIVNRMQKVGHPPFTRGEVVSCIDVKLPDARSWLATTGSGRRHAVSAGCLRRTRHGIVQPAIMGNYVVFPV